MPADVTLVLVLHDHQPVGNFDGVFAQSYDEAYGPFLAFLERHPTFRLALHTSGPLLQWIALHRRDYLTRLRVLVDRGQVELWGGGFFEPILPSIPEPDRRGQIRAMADWLELELGQRPRGLWLTERVWEPGLASSLAAAGVEYVALDDAHFVAAGLERDALWGTFRTEDQGRAIDVFPIHRELRYLVPFGAPEDTVALLRGVAAGGDDRIAVLGDDGEKFGVWPGTFARCYTEGWLEQFVAALEAEPWIVLRTPGEALAAHASRGLVYLPSASYHEMQEWAMPPARQADLHRAAELLAPAFGDTAPDLLRGGHWRNFQSRYPESNRLHKRMQRASRRLWEHTLEGDAGWIEARTRLWRSQCNDAYWHGVFGGLYLPMLRSALYHELIATEAWLHARERAGAVGVERGDLDVDGAEDAVLETPAWAAWVSAQGGCLWALDDRDSRWNWGDTLARRPEFYHARLREAVVGGGEGESIHGALRVKEPGLAALVESYDPGGRESFHARWISDAATHDWRSSRFALLDGAGAVTLDAPALGAAPGLAKRFAVAADGMLDVELTLASERARRGTLEVELNVAMHVPAADDRWVEVNGMRADPPRPSAVARHAGVTTTAFVDAWAGRRLDVATSRAAALARAPIETVSLSESGAERVFQGLEARYAFDVSVGPGAPWRVRFHVAPRSMATVR